MDLSAALNLLNGLQEWLNIFRQNGFEKSVQIASQLIHSNDENGEVSISFKKQRVRIRRIFDDEAEDEPIANSKYRFEVEIFNVMVDTFILQIEERFSQLSNYHKKFQGLLDLPKFHTSDVEEIATI